MNSIREEKIKRDIKNTMEQTANTIAFAAAETVSVIAFIVVVGYLDGTWKDWIILMATASGIALRYLEKKTGWFQKCAKYFYLSISFWCTCVLIFTNDGKYAAVSQVYFMFLTVSIAYCDIKMVIYCAAITVVSTIGGLIFFPEAMLKVDEFSIWIYILIVFVLAAVLAAIIANRMRLLIEKTRQMKAYEDELVYLEQLQKKEEKHSEFIHNISHYFIAIGELARIENCEEIVELIQELNGKVLQNEGIIYTSHKVLNAILSEKSGEAAEQQTELEVYVEPVPSLDGITDGDLVSMVGNLLDNALEAAGKCEGEKRKISLRIFMEKEGRVCVMKLVNYFVTPPIMKKSAFISTKKNREMHGIGIKSVEKTAKKYGGYLQCLVEGDKFSSILILPVKS